MSQTDDVPDAVASFDDLVSRSASLVDDGIIEVEEVRLPTSFEELDYQPDYDAADVRAAVREELELVEESGEDEPEPQVYDTQAIDWPALWREFGFHTADAAGNIYASQTQLEAAIEASEQRIGGDVETHISRAVKSNILERVFVTDDHGTRHVAGYAQPGVYDGN